MAIGRVRPASVRSLKPRYLHDPWPIAASAVALVVAMPILVVVSSLAWPQWSVWRHLWQTQLPELIGNTLALIVGVGTGVALIGTALAWCVTMYQFPGRGVFEWLLILPLAIPAYVIGFVFLGLFNYAGPVQSGLRHAFGAHVWFPDIASFGGVVLVMTLVLYPYVYILARAAFLDQSATTLEAARSLGARPFAVFWRVALPLARPSIAAGMMLSLMEALADFGTVAIFNYPTFTVAIYRVWFGLFDRTAATQLACLLLFFTWTLYGLERGLRGRARVYQTQGSMRRATPIRLLGWKAWSISGAVGLVFSVAFCLPVVQLLVWTLTHIGNPDDNERYAPFMLNTLTVATVTAILAVGAAVIVAYGLRLSRSRVMAWCGRLAHLGYALPGSVIAVGVLIPLSFFDHTLDTWLQATWGISSGLLLTGSFVGLIFAYLARFLAVSTQTVEASLLKVTPSMDMAGRSLGAGPRGGVRGNPMADIGGGGCSATILVFVEVMKEMPATLLLRPFGYDTLAVRVWQLTSEALWEAAALPALTIIGVGMVPVLLLVRSSTGRQQKAGKLG